jgi:hypothetical protein
MASNVRLGQAFLVRTRKKTQGRQNSSNWKLKKKNSNAKKNNSFPAFGISDVRHLRGFHQKFAPFLNMELDEKVCRIPVETI